MKQNHRIKLLLKQGDSLIQEAKKNVSGAEKSILAMMKIIAQAQKRDKVVTS